MTDFEIIERSRLSAPGLRAFCKIADFWEFDETQRFDALGAPDHSTYHEWIRKARAKQAVTLTRDTLLRSLLCWEFTKLWAAYLATTRTRSHG